MQKKVFFILMLVAYVALGAVAADKKFTLVIDAGHGGHDSGAKGKISLEKNINLSVAMAFGKYVESNCRDVNVIYTRKTDAFVPLIERANIANRNKADLFISIHTNALEGGKISRGFETYTLGMHRAADNLNVAKRENSVILIEKNYKQSYEGFNPNSAESYIMFELMQDKHMANSVELAKMIQSEVCSVSGRVNKGVHQAGFLVLRETSMPSCLIELGFITTTDEEQYLNTKEGQDKMAKGIYQAFLKYKMKYGNSKLRSQDEDSSSTEANLLARNEDNGKVTEEAAEDADDMARRDDGSREQGDNDGLIAYNQAVEDDTEYAEQRAVRPMSTLVSQVAEVNELVEVMGQPPTETEHEMAYSPPTTAQETNPPLQNKTAPEEKGNVSQPQASAPQPNVPAPEEKTDTPQPTSPAPEPQVPSTVQNTPPTPPQVPIAIAKALAAEIKSTPPTSPTTTPTPESQAPAEQQQENTSVPDSITNANKSTPVASTTTPIIPTTPITPTKDTATHVADTLTHEHCDSVIVFKVQIAASSSAIPTNSDIFQGVKDVKMYTDNGMVKYTVGETTDFEEIGKLKQEMAAKFPQAFIVAFKRGERMDISKALKEYRNNKNNRK